MSVSGGDDSSGWQQSPSQAVHFADEIAAVRAVLGAGLTEACVVAALSRCGGNTEHAINALLDDSADAAEAGPNKGRGDVAPELAKAERDVGGAPPPVKVKAEALDDASSAKAVKSKPTDWSAKGPSVVPHRVKERAAADGRDSPRKGAAAAAATLGGGISLVPRPKKRAREQLETIDLTTTRPVPYLNPRPIRALPPADAVTCDLRPILAVPPLDVEVYDPRPVLPSPLPVDVEMYEPRPRPRPLRATAPAAVTDMRMVVAPPDAEFGDFPEERDWLLVGKSYVPGLSTNRGMRRMDAGEIVHFAFPSLERRYGGVKVSAKKAAALAGIVRFSTKRAGEIGKLSPEWTQCLVPLVNSSKVKIHGKIVFPTMQLRLMQEILLYVSFYIHKSVFTEMDNSSCNMLEHANVNFSSTPLHQLLNLLKLKSSNKDDFSLRDLSTRKLQQILRGNHNSGDESTPVLGQTFLEQGPDEQAISEAALNKLVGAAETFDLEHQNGDWVIVITKKTFVVYRRAPPVYVNLFTGQATTKFPTATGTTRGGVSLFQMLMCFLCIIFPKILADAMGLGKTVMTIALILSNPRGECSNIERDTRVSPRIFDLTREMITSSSQDELEAHSTQGALSVFVHYGGVKTDNLMLMAQHDVVLTTYGVLSAAYKDVHDCSSIFHRIDWYRIVLDEAHTIKSPKTKVAQAAFRLNSECRWCLTGTPLQNGLEDLYSLFCFLHVEPWCNENWWQKLIQKPYENGDDRGLKIVRAILRPIMLRRNKETKDKIGNPILVLPPAHIEVVECEQSEHERDFYEALFRRSKVQFDKFVAQGSVLNNYANILELLLRLRQCCNHPFLVISRADPQKYADLDKLAQRFLEGVQSCSGRQNALPSRAYVEEVVEEIRQGATTECPICLESASDDPVLTPCAHRMCHECLLSSWRTPDGGPCPLCRCHISKSGLIILPAQCRFQVDAENNWKDSCKVSKLIMILEDLQKKKEKSIVFSQFTSFFDLLEIPFNHNGIKFLRFDGKLSQKHKEKVLKEFSESQDKLVLLMSLKAGGVGLNLTAASNVFLMDTIEERMQQVQVRKQRMISGALTDEEVRGVRIKHLKMLFT
ncbi:putative SWI/SNF-related matrix-associated actin-dependent regulator of chromatin subfamily A member 3-like 3 [Dichanthelium oligosanthes]|uniref:Putative SWI/SNF-related matrix-associated actin-dependent regulator of chromatin subfamily A member 3-like 3 n=1 Tax=Dichanthelium oligosanthes TaxID=888268 RepID=A0A1E5UNB4_9POAL|nr:putative SWI/SNF-related matrix-associated actin-dependent regulator of chromatin subfamily A member 3-like 3 [Dichanthelium oligosanthes]